MKQILKTTPEDQFCSQTPGMMFLRVERGNNAFCGCTDHRYVLDEELYKCFTPQEDGCATYVTPAGDCVDYCDNMPADYGVCYVRNGTYHKIGIDLELVCGQNLGGERCLEQCATEQRGYNNECYSTNAAAAEPANCKDSLKLIDHKGKRMQLIDVCVEDGQTVYFDGTTYTSIRCPQPLGSNSSCCSDGEALFIGGPTPDCVAYDTYYSEFSNCQYRTGVLINGSVQLYCLGYFSKLSGDVGVNKYALIAIYTVCCLLVLGSLGVLIYYLHKRSLDTRSPASFEDKYNCVAVDDVSNLTSS